MHLAAGAVLARRPALWLAVLAFLVILAVGFLYAWQRGALEWD